jgi:predicted HicB family RNase H-like nuclease
MEHKGYIATLSYDSDREMFRGEVINTASHIDFYAEGVNELKQAMADSVDTYLDVCKERGIEPEKPFSGKLLLRLGVELHALASLGAAATGQSLNEHLKSLVLRDAEKRGFSIPTELAARDLENQ